MERIKVSLSVIGVFLVCATSLASVVSAPAETPWSNWSDCTQTCGYGVQLRSRPCPHGDHAECTVSELGELRRCKLRECPIDGGWSDWSRWRSCSKTCGAGGTRLRYRACTKPRPQYGGLQCEGSNGDQIPCSPLRPCPVDGGWTDWTEWGACQAKVCRKKGNRFRTRSCSNPEPLYDGNYCEGASSESEKCKKADCPVHGGWSAWRDSTPCSSSCEYSTQNQTRTCDNPTPVNSTTRRGKDCIGPSSKTIPCQVPASCQSDDGSDIQSSFETGNIPTTSTTPEEVVLEDSPWSSVSSVAVEGPKEFSGWISEGVVIPEEVVLEDSPESFISVNNEVTTSPENEQPLSSFGESQVLDSVNSGNEQPSAGDDGPTTPGTHDNGGEGCDPASDPDASSFCP